MFNGRGLSDVILVSEFICRIMLYIVDALNRYTFGLAKGFTCEYSLQTQCRRNRVARWINDQGNRGKVPHGGTDIFL